MPASLKWWLENECVAVAEYQMVKHYEVVPCGIVVNPRWPWLGASPDGVIFDKTSPIGGIEVKCPYNGKNETINEIILRNKNFFLKADNAGKIYLKKKHPYYSQYQGIMSILELQWIDFVVYATKDIVIERIERDANLWHGTMLPLLTQFYLDFIST